VVITGIILGVAMTDNYPVAQQALARGWAVFPCGSDKKPLCKWKEAATHDPQRVFDFWEAHPQALVGIPAAINDFWALDLDTHEAGVDGVKNFQDLAKKYGAEDIEVGPMQSTPRGGKHLLFKLGAWDIPQTQGEKIAPGIHIRSAGYICTGDLPDGRAYVWNSAEGHGMDASITEAPRWLLDVVGAKQFDTSPIDTAKESQKPVNTAQGDIDFWLEKYLPQATIGRRNETGFNLACQVRDAGYSQAEAEALPYPERCPQGQDVYDRAEWLASVKSAYDRTPREPAKARTPTTSPMTGDELADYFADLPEPEAPPTPQETPGEAQQSKPDESTTKRPRYILRDAAYALHPQPPIDYIVDGLITNSSVNLFYGEPGSKKTYTALSLAVCVANGKPWLNFKTKKAPVLIVDEESGERRFTRRLGEAIRGELCDTSSPIYYVCLAGFKLDDLNDPVLIQALLIEQTGARLVIFDALADLMDGDENSKQDTQPVFNALRKMSEATDSAILIIHHSNKAGGYRGSSAIKGSVDLMVQVQSENGSPFINFQSEKNRDGDKAAWAAEAIWTEDEFYLKPSDRRPTESRERELYVIKYLTDHGPSFLTDLMAAADTCTPGGAKQGLYALAKHGKVKRTNPGNRKAMYELTAPPVTRDAPVTLP